MCVVLEVMLCVWPRRRREICGGVRGVSGAGMRAVGLLLALVGVVGALQ